MVLLPKEFHIDTAKIDGRFRAIASSNYDGVVSDGVNFVVCWKTTPSDADLAVIETYWNNLTQVVYNTLTAAETQAYLAGKLDAAVVFGKALVVSTAVDNIAMGITQAGKTRAVADYCQKLEYYLSTGSLYAAIEELNAMVADTNRSGLSPYITDDRLNNAISKISAFLGI